MATVMITVAGSCEHGARARMRMLALCYRHAYDHVRKEVCYSKMKHQLQLRLPVLQCSGIYVHICSGSYGSCSACSCGVMIILLASALGARDFIPGLPHLRCYQLDAQLAQ